MPWSIVQNFSSTCMFNKYFSACAVHIMNISQKSCLLASDKNKKKIALPNNFFSLKKWPENVFVWLYINWLSRDDYLLLSAFSNPYFTVTIMYFIIIWLDLLLAFWLLISYLPNIYLLIFWFISTGSDNQDYSAIGHRRWPQK